MRNARTRGPRTLLAVAVGALALGAVSGCGDDIPFDQLRPITGTYSLTTLDGDSLPILLDDGGGTGPRVELLAGVLLLSRDESFTLATDFRLTEEGETSFVSENVTGEWTAEAATGTTVTFLPDSAALATFTGVASVERMTLTFQGETWVLDR